MTLRIAAVLLAGVVGIGCTSSSKGDPGPQGPSGPPGATGAQGNTGQPVLSAQLAVGSIDCPRGGSQFTSASGTTFACNGTDGAAGAQGAQGLKGDKGDQGSQGPTGPFFGMQAADASGAPLGVVFGHQSNDGTNGLSALSNKMWVLLMEQPGGTGTPKVFVWRNSWDGSPLGCGSPATSGYPIPLEFASSDCSGQGYVETQIVAPIGFACNAWTNNGWRLITAEGPVISLDFHSFRYLNGACSVVSGPATNPRAIKVVDLAAGTFLAAPLQFSAP